MIFNKIIKALKKIKVSQVSIKWEQCHLCQWKIQIKIFDDEMGVRCTRCSATPVSQMLGKVFNELFNKNIKHIYELSSRGAFVRFLKKRKLNLTLSEYFDDTLPGEFRDGIQCQNVEKLTFKDNSFDVCTSLEVFEHVENDQKGFQEIYRVLKANGMFIFTVPIDLNNKTIERTAIVDGERINIHPPIYHSDNIRGSKKVFCYRDYGHDITQKLSQAGFNKCDIFKPSKSILFGYARPIIIATKA